MRNGARRGPHRRLAIAREKARESRLLLSEGKDPIVARDAAERQMR